LSLIIGQGVVEWVAKRTNEHGNFGCAQGIGWQRHGQIVAGVVYNEFNGVNCLMHVASDGSRRWLHREFLRVAFDYPFNQLKVRRVTGLVGEGNIAAREFDEHLGFTLETRLENAHPTGDLLIYRMWKSDCRWLNENLHPLRLRLAA